MRAIRTKLNRAFRKNDIDASILMSFLDVDFVLRDVAQRYTEMYDLSPKDVKRLRQAGYRVKLIEKGIDAFSGNPWSTCKVSW